jgi:glutamyl-tRNA synthetase
MSFSGPARTRIAPSPTGIAHVGTAWMAMFNLAVARQTHGQFLIRIEDTDRNRFVEGAEEKIYEGLEWLGIAYDEGGQKGGPHEPYKQSQRLELYQKYAKELVDAGHAYYCFCTSAELAQMREEQQKRGELPKYDRRWRDADPEVVKQKLAAGESHVIRLKVPDNRVFAWEDLIRGRVEFASEHVDDQVLMKSDGFPTYHLAVVVDDHLMGITHILRGEEWISSTPKHLLLFELFGWELPLFAHMPLIRNPDRSKLSKRKNDVSILSYRDKGYLPEALVNFLATLGWSHPDGKEVFTLAEFLESVSIERIQKTAPVFDVQKLNWLNGQYIRQLPASELKQRLAPYMPSDFPSDRGDEILPLVVERLVTLTDLEQLTAFFYRDIQLDTAVLLKKGTPESVQAELAETIPALESVSEWTTEALEKIIRDLQEKHDWPKSQYFMMIRAAVTGATATPPLFDTLRVLGKDRVLARLQSAAQKVS